MVRIADDLKTQGKQISFTLLVLCYSFLFGMNVAINFDDE